jgi:hypothetical protein
VADPSATVLVDIDIKYAPGWEELRENNHFNMADDPRIQDFAASQFPDLIELAETRKVTGGSSMIAFPVFGDPTGPAPQMRVQSSPEPDPGANVLVTHQELYPAPQTSPIVAQPNPIVPSTDPIAARDEVRRKNPFVRPHRPAMQQSGTYEYSDHQSSGRAQVTSNDAPALESESVAPYMRGSAVVAPLPPVWSSTSRYQNYTYRKPTPTPSAEPPSGPYGSYRVTGSR